MTQKWCSQCRKQITEPPASQMSRYALFWRDNRCYLCNGLLTVANSPPIQPQSLPSYQPQAGSTSAATEVKPKAAVPEESPPTNVSGVFSLGGVFVGLILAYLYLEGGMAGPNPRERYNLFNVFAISGVLGGILGGFMSYVVRHLK